MGIIKIELVFVFVLGSEAVELEERIVAVLNVQDVTRDGHAGEYTLNAGGTQREKLQSVAGVHDQVEEVIHKDRFEQFCYTLLKLLLILRSHHCKYTPHNNPPCKSLHSLPWNFIPAFPEIFPVLSQNCFDKFGASVGQFSCSDLIHQLYGLDFEGTL